MTSASSSEDVPGSQDVPGTDARLNAERLGLASRWRHALQEPGGPGDDEFWEAGELSEIWAQAEHDDVLLAILQEDEADVVGLQSRAEHKPLVTEVLDEHELARAQARFESRMQEARATRPALQVLVADTSEPQALTVGEVVEAMEHEAQRVHPESAGAAGSANWRSVLAPVRTSHEPLPAHITAKAMREFWMRKGLAVPREVSAAFSQVARLLLMSRATPGARLSLARSSRPSGISHVVERLAAQASPEKPEETEAAAPQKEHDQDSDGA